MSSASPLNSKALGEIFRSQRRVCFWLPDFASFTSAGSMYETCLLLLKNILFYFVLIKSIEMTRFSPEIRKELILELQMCHKNCTLQEINLPEMCVSSGFQSPF